MSEESTERRVVIRAPAPGSEGTPSPSDPTAQGSRNRQPSSSGSRSRPSVSEIRFDLSLSIIGGLLLCAAPLLPWWHVSFRTLSILGDVKVGGLSTWMGLLCLVSGVAVVGIEAASLSGVRQDLRTALACAAYVGAAAAVAALVGGGSLVGLDTPLTAEIGLYLALAGGAAASTGASLEKFGDGR